MTLSDPNSGETQFPGKCWPAVVPCETDVRSVTIHPGILVGSEVKTNFKAPIHTPGIAPSPMAGMLKKAQEGKRAKGEKRIRAATTTTGVTKDSTNSINEHWLFNISSACVVVTPCWPEAATYPPTP